MQKPIINSVKKNQLDAQLILSISACFGRIYTHHQEVQLHVYNNLYLLFFLDDSLLSWLECSITVRTAELYDRFHFFILNHSCIRVYNRLPEDEPSVSKYVEDVKIKNKTLIYKMCISLVCVLQFY